MAEGDARHQASDRVGLATESFLIQMLSRLILDSYRARSNPINLLLKTANHRQSLQQMALSHQQHQAPLNNRFPERERHSVWRKFNLPEGDRQGGTVVERYQGGVATAQRKRPRSGGTCCSKMRSAKRGPQQVQVPSGRGVFERSTPRCLRAEALSRPGSSHSNWTILR